MSKKFLIGMSFVMVMGVAGCASSDGGGLTTRMYVEDRARVDQQISQGANQGYLVGAPKAKDQGDQKKTRKMFVLEFTKNPPGADEVKDIQVIERTHTVTKVVAPPPRRRPEPRPAPVVEETQPSIEYVDYTIEKNDTLQKISKKFYDTYRKWPQIYDANKDAIKDPNHIKPGTNIKIPMEKGPDMPNLK